MTAVEHEKEMQMEWKECLTKAGLCEEKRCGRDVAERGGYE